MEDQTWVIEVALDRKPDSIEYDEKHFLLVAETNKDAAEKMYRLADELYPKWANADILICGREKTNTDNFDNYNNINYFELS